MKLHTSSAVLLGLLLSAGCADRGDNQSPPGNQRTAPAAAEPAPDGARADDAREPRDRRPEAPGTAGRAEGSQTPSSVTARADAERPAEERRTPASRRGAEWREITVPEGTALPLELETALSSETATVETPVRARLKQAVIVNGVTALPIGAVVSGEVIEARRAGRVKGRATLSFGFSQVRADNLTARLKTAPLAYVAEATRGEDATKIGAGAVGGAIVGGIVGGGEGAAKGAAIGGAAGTGVVLATRGKEVELPSGTSLAATLAAPLTLRVPAGR